MNNLINYLKCFSVQRNGILIATSGRRSILPAIQASLYSNNVEQKAHVEFECCESNLVRITMSRRFENNGMPPRKIPRFINQLPPMGLNLMPPLPPPHIVNCGELREHHHGTIVEMDGRVNKSRMGRFIELKDQYGITQIVAPIDNIMVSKRFANMPLNAFITIVGQVKRRPANLKNFSMPTGEVEVHVNNIIRVQKIFRHGAALNGFGKRNYSTMTSISNNESGDENTMTSITSTECKRVKNNENLVQWFMNRKHTCGSLRLRDAGKIVTLVGWIDKKQSKFVHLTDGYGNIQILIEDENLRTTLNSAGDNNLVLMSGRVLARPKTHVTHNSTTGEIEIYADNVRILDENSIYNETNLNGDSMKSIERKIEANVNEFTCRSHNCGELRETDIGKEVTLCGWLEFSRMNKFFTLRDAYGHTQVIVPTELMKTVNCDSISFESILRIKGRVIPRPPKMVNPKMATGAIEIELTSLDVLNAASTEIPVQVRTFNRSNESSRMKYRYIDLRFDDMQRNLRLRSSVLMKMREYLVNNVGFVEVETPTLFRRTPGGAQEFVVPTQKPGQFYSLVQSPQQFKQMLMAGAIDRYFQIARCYRDETTTVNRQPEFTQLDIELSFTSPNDIINLIENVLLESWPKELGTITVPFNRMSFNDAMDKYGSDKPDTRYSQLLLRDVTSALSETLNVDNCKKFAAYAIPVQRTSVAGLSQALELNFKATAQQNKINFVKIKIDETGACENNNNLSEDNKKAIIHELNLQPNDVVILSYGDRLNVQNLLGKFRTELISNLIKTDIIPKVADNLFEFLWVIDFPLFTPNEETGQLETTHHPFTAPHPDDMHLLNSPETYDQCRSLAYDIVLNGQEIGGGSIRLHDAKLQRRILNEILKIDSDHLAHLLAALESGCPPHGGIALGLDRLLSIMCNTKSIRDVIAFPKSADGKDLLSNAPCAISKDELQLYHLEIRK